ncbi:MAG: DUF4834 family protein [Bacteroidota bacterium]|nr:DUF4834 family protein [Bacteroidota bacterium]
MILRFILFALVAWFVYRLVFNLILPVARTTRQIRRQFSAMQEQMQQHQAQQEQEAGTHRRESQPSAKSPDIAGDYIDFEEVKETH